MIDPKISAFIKKHHVFTLATSRDNIPWVAHCFYAFLEKEACLVFTTDPETRHGMEMMDNAQVACGIAWETKLVGQVRGAQITGKAIKAEDSSIKNIKTAYLKKFPYAAAVKLDLWVLEIERIKYTDNRLGFGKKIFWERDAIS